MYLLSYNSELHESYKTTEMALKEVQTSFFSNCPSCWITTDFYL